MSVILYLWVIILQLYHYDSRLPLKNLNIEIFSFFPKLLDEVVWQGYMCTSKKKRMLVSTRYWRTSTKGRKVTFAKSVIKLWLSVSTWTPPSVVLKAKPTWQILKDITVFQGQNWRKSLRKLWLTWTTTLIFQDGNLTDIFIEVSMKKSRKFSFKSGGEILSEWQICFLF